MGAEHEAASSARSGTSLDRLLVENLGKQFGSNRVLHSVSLHAQLGKITALIGQNGAGKSTLFKIVMGLLDADSGSVRFAGHDILALPLHAKAGIGIGYLPQDAASFDELTIRQNLAGLVELLRRGRAWQGQRTARLLDLVGLSAIADRPYRYLSKGEQRRLEIAKALSSSPRMLLLDEPFSGLDPLIVEELIPILRTLANDGVGILLTDHNIHMTLPFVDAVFVLAGGKVLCQGTPQEIEIDELARQHYLGRDFALPKTGADN